MRVSPSLALLLLGLGLAPQASAQCCYLPVPRAPDMLNPGYYVYNCQGYLYGPYHNVYPPFPPFQGMLPGPKGPPGGMGQGGMGQGGMGYGGMGHGGMGNGGPPPGSLYGRGGQMPQVVGAPGCGPDGCGPNGPGPHPGFWFHPAVRSPRDFYLDYPDPALAAYRGSIPGGSPVPPLSATFGSPPGGTPASAMSDR